MLQLLPILITSVTAIMVMLAIAIKRYSAVTILITVVGLLLALSSIVYLNFHPNIELSPMFNNLIAVNSFSYLYMVIILFSALICVSLASDYFRKYQEPADEFYILVLLATVGALLLVNAIHFASFFLGLELLSIPTYGMLAYTRQRKKSLESGLKYLILSATASATLLFGIALWYAATGTMSFIDFNIDSASYLYTILAGVMILIAISFKLSIAPFHQWAPDVYQGAPIPVAVYLATVSKAAVFAVFIRVFLLYRSDLMMSSNDGTLYLITSAFAICSMILGNVLALNQKNYLRMLGLSSVAHMGYAMIAVISFNIIYANLYIVAYVMTSLVSFGVISIIASPFCNKNEAGDWANFTGLYWRKPILSILLTISLLSLSGVPLTLGFMTKLFVVLTAIDSNQWLLSGMLILGSGISLFYYLRAVLNLFNKETNQNRIDENRCSFVGKINYVLIGLLGLLLIVFGLFPDSLFSLVTF